MHIKQWEVPVIAVCSVYFLLRAQVHTIVKIQLEIQELLIGLKIYLHLSVTVLSRLLESQVIGKDSGVLLGKIDCFFVIQLMKWSSFTALAPSACLNGRARCARESEWRYSLCAARYLELPLQAQDVGSSHLCFSHQQPFIETVVI